MPDYEAEEVIKELKEYISYEDDELVILHNKAIAVIEELQNTIEMYESSSSYFDC